jgi:hypothetical protein
MPLSVTLTGYPWWVAGTSVLTDVGGRLHDVSAMTYAGDTRGGVLVNTTTPLVVSAASGMNVTVGKGGAVIPSASGATDGGYRAQNSAAQTLTVAASDPTNPRIDIAVIQILATSPPTAAVSLITGTAAPSPSAPATPSNAILLAQIAVGAGVTSITAGNITDKRLFTSASGGIIPVAAASAPTGYTGNYIHDTTSSSLRHNTAGGVVQAHVLPFTPQVAVKTTDTSSTGSEVSVVSVSVTTDGSTDLDIFAIASYLQQTTGSSHSAGTVGMLLYLDSTVLIETETPITTEAQWTVVPAIHYQTTSLLGTTPSAGSHTISLRFQPAATGTDTVLLKASSTGPVQLRVRAVTL